MIKEFGAQEGDAVLDSEIIFSWFQELAVIPIEEAAKIVALPDWRTIPAETLLKLRHIKSALNTLSYISETGMLRKHPELNDWFLLRGRLP